MVIRHYFNKISYTDNIVNNKIYNNEYIINYYSLSNCNTIYNTPIGIIHFINSRRTMWFPYFSFTAFATIKYGDEYIEPLTLKSENSRLGAEYLVNLYTKKSMRRKTLWNSFLEYYGTFTLSSLLFCFSCYLAWTGFRKK